MKIPKLAFDEIVAEGMRPHEEIIARLRRLSSENPEIDRFLVTTNPETCMGFLWAYLAIEAALEKRELDELERMMK